MDIGRQATGGVAVGNSTDFLVVLRTTVAGIDDHGHARQVSQCLQSVEQVVIHYQTAAAAAFELFSREMPTKVPILLKLIEIILAHS